MQTTQLVKENVRLRSYLMGKRNNRTKNVQFHGKKAEDTIQHKGHEERKKGKSLTSR